MSAVAGPECISLTDLEVAESSMLNVSDDYVGLCTAGWFVLLSYTYTCRY